MNGGPRSTVTLFNAEELELIRCRGLYQPGAVAVVCRGHGSAKGLGRVERWDPEDVSGRPILASRPTATH
jgi:hypothetical protein